jgi:integrase
VTHTKLHHERPIRRTNLSGKVVWVARYTRPDGQRHIWKPAWNGGRGTFGLQRDAQRAIDEAYEFWETRPVRSDTIGGYFATWTERHPRSERTNDTNKHRIGRVLDVELGGLRLADWVISDLRRRHATELLDHLLRVQGRSARGAKHILSALSAMCENAIDDELADLNPFRGLRIRNSDPRITKKPRPVRVFGFADMHAFAAAAGAARTGRSPGRTARLDSWRAIYAEAMVRTLSDLGLRLGELLPLQRGDLDVTVGVLRVRRTAHNGKVLDGTKTDHGEEGAGRDVPVPPTLMAMLRALPSRIDCPLLFPTPTGRLWQERNFYRDVWDPARQVACSDVRPHEMRHSFISHLRAAGVDDADLADIGGHTVETMLGKYTHALRRSHDQVREIIG